MTTTIWKTDLTTFPQLIAFITFWRSNNLPGLTEYTNFYLLDNSINPYNLNLFDII